MPLGTKGQSSIALRRTISGAGRALVCPASCVLRSARCGHNLVPRGLAPVLGAKAVPLQRLCDFFRHRTIRDFMALPRTQPHAHSTMPLSVLDAPAHSCFSLVATARLDRSLFVPFLFPSGSRALVLSSLPHFACTEHPTPQSKKLPHHHHTVPWFQLSLVLATAPLRSLRSWPPHRLPGSTPQSHVVGVGCGRIAPAIQGSGTGAELPVQERSGAVADHSGRAAKGSAPQKQMLVQMLSEGSDRRPTGARSHCKQPTRSADGGQGPPGKRLAGLVRLQRFPLAVRKAEVRAGDVCGERHRQCMTAKESRILRVSTVNTTVNTTVPKKLFDSLVSKRVVGAWIIEVGFRKVPIVRFRKVPIEVPESTYLGTRTVPIQPSMQAKDICAPHRLRRTASSSLARDCSPSTDSCCFNCSQRLSASRAVASDFADNPESAVSISWSGSDPMGAFSS